MAYWNEPGDQQYQKWCQVHETLLQGRVIMAGVYEANNKVAAVLDELARYTKESGDSGRAFGIGRAANAIRNSDRNIADLSNLNGMKGVGPSTIALATEILTTGTCARLQELRVLLDLPDLSQLQRIPGVGPVKAKSIWETYRITTLEQLRALVNDGSFNEPKVIDGLDFVERSNEYTPRPWAEAAGQHMIDLLKPFAYQEKITFGGSIRRKKDLVREIDILIACECAAEEIYEAIRASGMFVVQYGGQQKIRIEYALHDGKVIGGDVIITTPAEWPFALCYLTGSKEFNPGMRAIALSKGYTLNEHRLESLTTHEHVPIREESELFEFLGMPFVPPECRQTREDAGRDFSHVLVDAPKGEVHVHTMWSDGLRSARDMCQIAYAKGFRFMGFSDHTKSLPQGVAESKLGDYATDLRNAGAEFGIKTYAGLELDINAAHTIVYEYRSLKQNLDYVILAIHHAIGTNMVTRYLAAIDQINDIPAIIAHVTGRLFGARDQSEGNWQQLFEVCAKKNILIELNGQPDRLDPSIDLIKQAKQAGCKFILATDDHGHDTTTVMMNAWYMARAAGLTREDVILDADEFASWLTRA
jgi:DNA polymerase (family X)